MITFRGLALVAIAFFTFLLARLTQVGWLYLLDAMLWGAILVSVAMPWLAIASLSAQRRLLRHSKFAASTNPVEDETVDIELRLANGRFWPRYLLSVSYECALASPGERLQRFFVTHLAVRDKLSLVSTVECHRRGFHHLGPIMVESKAPFGLFRRRKKILDPLSVLVYPKVYPLNRLALTEGMQGATMRPRRIREGQEIGGSRDYFPGDPIRHVHWRNTARIGHLIVKEFEDSQENALVVLFDSTQNAGQGRETLLEYSIKLTASVAGYVLEQGGQVTVQSAGLPGHELPWAVLLRELATLECGQGPSIQELAQSVPSGSRMLALVAETDIRGIETLCNRASHMSRLTVVVLQGFQESSPVNVSPDIEKLYLAGASVVHCCPGELQETLRALEHLDLSSKIERQTARAF